MRDFGTAVILAGGASRRMGFDKQRLCIEGGSLVAWQLRRLRPLFSHFVIVTRSPELYADCDALIVADRLPGLGPLSGLHAGLCHAQSRWSYLLACDMPVLNLEYISFMQGRLEQPRSSDEAGQRGKTGQLVRKDPDNSNHPPEACVTRFRNWIEPFSAFYHASFAARIEEAWHKVSAGAAIRPSIGQLLTSAPVHYIPESEAAAFSPDWSMFMNLNTTEDLARFPDLSVCG